MTFHRFEILRDQAIVRAQLLRRRVLKHVLSATLNEKKDRLGVMPQITANDVVYVTEERINSDVSSKPARRHIFLRIQAPMPIVQRARYEQITGHRRNMHNEKGKGRPACGTSQRPKETPWPDR